LRVMRSIRTALGSNLPLPRHKSFSTFLAQIRPVLRLAKTRSSAAKVPQFLGKRNIRKSNYPADTFLWRRLASRLHRGQGTLLAATQHRNQNNAGFRIRQTCSLRNGPIVPSGFEKLLDRPGAPRYNPPPSRTHLWPQSWSTKPKSSSPVPCRGVSTPTRFDGTASSLHSSVLQPQRSAHTTTAGIGSARAHGRRLLSLCPKRNVEERVAENEKNTLSVAAKTTKKNKSCKCSGRQA